MEKTSNFSYLNNIFKLEITFLIDLVAIAGFFTMALPLTHLYTLIPLLVAGTSASMSSGVFNNLYDTDIDSRMKRVSKRRTDIKQNRGRYILLMGILLAISVTTSLLFLNIVTFLFIMAGFVSYAFLYTVLLKRRTEWNIVIGGIAGSFPALAGSSAFYGYPSIPSIYVAIMVFLWTPTHFWALAIKYREDYREANIPMLPATKGIPATRKAILANSIILAIFMSLPVFFTWMVSGLYFRIFAIPLGLILLVPSVIYYVRNGAEKEYRKLFSFSNIFLTLALIIVILSSM